MDYEFTFIKILRRVRGCSAPYIFILLYIIFPAGAREMTKDDIIAYIIVYIGGGSLSLLLDNLLGLTFYPFTIIFFAFGHAIVFSIVQSIIKNNYFYIITSTGVMYYFKWLWRSMKYVDFSNISTIVITNESKRNIGSICFYDIAGVRIMSFYGVGDPLSIIPVLISSEDREENKDYRGVLEKCWGSENIMLMPVRGIDVEGVIIMNVKFFTIELLEKIMREKKKFKKELNCGRYKSEFELDLRKLIDKIKESSNK